MCCSKCLKCSTTNKPYAYCNRRRFPTAFFKCLIPIIRRKSGVNRQSEKMPIRIDQHHRVVVRVRIAVLCEDVIVIPRVRDLKIGTRHALGDSIGQSGSIDPFRCHMRYQLINKRELFYTNSSFRKTAARNVQSQHRQPSFILTYTIIILAVFYPLA